MTIRLIDIEAIGIELEGMTEQFKELEEALKSGAIPVDDLSREVVQDIVHDTIGNLWQAALDAELVIKKQHRRISVPDAIVVEQRYAQKAEDLLRSVLQGMTAEERERFLRTLA